MNGNKSLLINLPATDDDLTAEIVRQDQSESPIQSDEDVVKFIITRLAMIDLEIDRSLEKGDITEEEAEELRDKYVKGAIRDLYHDESI